MASPAIDDLLESIALLPEDWHTAGSVTMPVLRGLARLASARRIDHSMETGSGKTTLLLSHLSADHTVFAIGEYDGVDTRSIGNVRASPLFESSRVRFVEGPTQLTLPRHEFPHMLQLALIDGPHGYPFPDLEYYYVYPHLAEDALLVVDDIHIPTVRNLFDFLREDEMFQLLEVIENTAFFRRTTSPTFSTTLDGWWLQAYNKKRFPIAYRGDGPLAQLSRLKPLVPRRLLPLLRRLRDRPPWSRSS